MFSNNPKINIRPNETDKKLIRIGYIVIALHFILVFAFYFQLPDTIPVHFNLRGDPDGYGHKSTLWVLPILNMALYCGLTLIATKMKPWNYNYPVKVNEKNAPRLYAISIRMMTSLNLAIALLFFIISVYSIVVVKSIKIISMGWVLALVILIVTILPFIYIVKMFKVSKE